jgi:uncharacterized protein
LSGEPLSDASRHLQTPSGNRPTAVVILVCLVLLALVVLGVWRGNKPSRLREGDSIQNVISGDVQLKLSYFLKTLGQAKEYRKAMSKAVDSYESAALDSPTPRAFRRLGLVRGINSSSDALGAFARIADPKVTKGVSRADRVTLRREAAMWKRVYSGERISGPEVKNYLQLLHQIDLGPTKYIAMSRIHHAAGMRRLAQTEEEEARTRYTAHMTILLIVFAGLALMGLTGLLFLVGGAVMAFASPGILNRILRLGDTYPLDAPLEPALWRAFLVYMMIFASLSILGGRALGALPKDLPHVQVFNVTIVAQLVVSLLTGVLGVGVLAWLTRSGGGIKSIGLKCSGLMRDVLWGVAGYAVALPLLGLGAIVGMAVKRLLPNAPTPPNQAVPMLLYSPSALGLLAVIVLATVMAPVFEEMFFRGALFRALRSRLGVWPGILLSASAFALLHPLPAGFFPIFALGSVFAILVQARDSLIPAMVAHALNNGVLLVLLALAARG